jgi:DNA-binding transcriptional regulator YiaG
MTPQELKAARRTLGLSQRTLAIALSDPDNPDGHKVDPRTIRRWESSLQIPGPVIRCIRYMLKDSSLLTK